MQLLDLYDFTTKFLQEQTGVTTVSGMPRNALPEVVLPCFAVEFGGFGFSSDVGRRTLANSMGRQKELALVVHGYAQTDMEMIQMLDMMVGVMGANPDFQASGQRVQLTWNEIVRNYGELETVLDFAFSFSVVLRFV